MSHNVTLELGNNQVPLVLPEAAVAYQVCDTTVDAITGSESYQVKVWYYTESNLKAEKKIYELTNEILQQERSAKFQVYPVVCNPRTQSEPDTCATAATELFHFTQSKDGYWTATDGATIPLDLLVELGRKLSESTNPGGTLEPLPTGNKRFSGKLGTEIVTDKKKD